MTNQNEFAIVGARGPQVRKNTTSTRINLPIISIVLLSCIVLFCLFSELIMTKDPTYLDASHYRMPPSREFLFGTDTLGRDLFSGIWYGGRISLFIGFASTLLSTLIATIYGSISGMAPAWLDTLMMRLTEIFLSIPTLLVIVFLQAILGEANILSITCIIGVTSWCSIAKIVRTEVRTIRNSEYVIAAKCMGGNFFHIFRHHLAPNFLSSIMFMVVMNVRAAIVAESTLSFLGIGLPISVISWGSMLSLAEQALLSRAWWIVLIPGLFLVTVLVCLTNIGHWLQKI